jgi:hypothetical protein
LREMRYLVRHTFNIIANMNKTFYIIIVLFVCNEISGQESTLYQKQWYDNGLKYLKKGKLDIAISQFNLSNSFGENLDIRRKSREKIDSLLPKVQSNSIKQWKGNWKIKELNYNPYPGTFSEYIRFDDTLIVFYQKDLEGKEKIIRSEPIRFLPYDSLKTEFNVRKIVFRNSEIWSFWVEKKKSQMRLYPKLERDSLGTSKILLDERAIIGNKKLREKELKKEIHTFYVLAK